jgi:formylmethanofuran dehydrogenase subunit A
MDGRNNQSENLGLSIEDGQEKKVVSGDLNIQMNLDALKDVKKQYKKIKRYMRSSIYTVAMMDGREQIVSRLLKDQEDNPA